MSAPPSRIEVFCRVRPTDKICVQQIQFQPNNNIQIFQNARRSATGLGGEQQIMHNFSFDGVFTGSQGTQENVYRGTTQKLVQKGLLDGINASLLCYGQRDSGKTYTVFGGTDYRARGIAARAINQLFEGVRLYAQERIYGISLTFIELHGDNVTDLLSSGGNQSGNRGTMRGSGRSGRSEQPAKPSITLDAKGMVVMKGIERRECATEEEALAAVFEGLHQRSQNHSAHVALTLYARHQSLIDSESATREACLHIVDLGGTQRIEGTSSAEERQNIQTVNRSLSMLEQVVITLGNPTLNSNGEPVLGHVPYRQSKLTTMLKDCIGGTSLTSLIAHIYPEQQYVDMTIATLNFAKRMMHVTTDPVVNLVQDAGTQIRTLQRQVTDLKSELRMQSQLSLARAAQNTAAGGASEAGKPTSFGTDELQALHEKVRSFVDGASSTIHVNDVREMNACFNFFRTLLEQKDVTISELQNEMNTIKAQSAYAMRSGREMESMGSTQLSSAEPQAPPSNSTSTKAAPPSAKGKRRSTSNWRQQQQPPEKADPHTPNVLDKHSGVSYGVAGKASNVLQVPDRDPTADMEDVGRRPPQNVNFMQENNYNTSNTNITPIFKPNQIPTSSSSVSASQVPASNEDRRPPATFSPRQEVAAPPPTSLPPRPMSDSSRFRPGGNKPSVPTMPEKPSLAAMRDAGFAYNNNGSPNPSSASSPMKQTPKAKAFEDYKNTESGALQVRALGDDREQLLRIDKKVHTLQRRLQELEYVMLERAHSTNAARTSSRPQSGGRSGSAEEDEEDPRHMSPLHLTAYHNTIQESLNGVNAQRQHLTKQMERRRMALMTNFSEWYSRISGDNSERPQRMGFHAGFPSTNQQNVASSKNTRKQQTSFLDDVDVTGGRDEDVQQMMQLQDDRFLDAAERFNAMEMHRRTAQDPQSGAFYSAKKLVESKTRDRPQNRS